uniref:Kinetochore protein Spc24 n=1 Tax=Chenopodium quinoa TaxID=63459 RepID=A0A803MK49_CHEQI
MVDNSPQIDINQLLSYCDDLVGVLRDKRDFNLLTQCVQQSKSIQSSSDSDFNTTQIAISVIVDKINELDHQRLSLEEQSQRLKKLEDEHEKEQRKLSFYASVTKIIPDLENPSKISGHIIDRDKKAVEKFEFDPLQEDAFDICNKTWKMINL